MSIDITFNPVPEVNESTVTRPARITFYRSLLEPDAVSVMLVSDDKYQTIEGGLRLTAEQVESLFYALGQHVGDELFDAGFKAGLLCAEGAA
jgi:hypothetical protein